MFPRPPHLVIFGAVHAAISLVRFGREVGFRTTVVDPRSAFATPERLRPAAALRASRAAAGAMVDSHRPSVSERMPQSDPDVVVLGAGPNGLTAAAYLARAGLKVLVLEANPTVGGAIRTAEATLPGFRHDLGSGFFVLAKVGPLGALPLHHYGLEWCHFRQPFGGGAPGGRGVAITAGVDAAGTSADSFEAAGRGDGAAYRALWQWWRRAGPGVLEILFRPLGDLPPLLRLGARLLGFPPQWDRALEFAQLGIAGARPSAASRFEGEDARVWFSGTVMHAGISPEAAGGGLYGLVLLGLSQEVGLPIPRGGGQTVAEALRRYVEAHGGAVLTGRRATRVCVRDRRAAAVQTDRGEEFAPRHAVLATVEPQQLFLHLVGEGHLPESFVHAVRRFRWATGVFKLDCALSAPPSFAAPSLQGVGALHLGDSVPAVWGSANAAARGLLPEHPLLVVGLHTLADPTRAPPGRHTLWIETHAPAQIAGDEQRALAARAWEEAKEPFADRMLAELERHAPGVTKLVLARYAQSPVDLEAWDTNLVGGDLSGGSFALDQQLVFRPVPGWFRHRTPLRGLYVGSASTHPGAGTHGAAGANAARILLRDLGIRGVSDRHRPSGICRPTLASLAAPVPAYLRRAAQGWRSGWGDGTSSTDPPEAV